uniref:AT-hook motif nuclear-localized protein n=2 Tax=Salix viminalis TaxID=40686 RepID=A0A6N2LWY9_SALVM
MELNDPQHQQQQHHFTSYFSTPTTNTPTPSPTNGLLLPHQPSDSTTATGAPMLYPPSMGPSTTATVTGGGAPVEAEAAAEAKRKRGRPRKYGTPEQALAAKKTASSNSAAAYREKKEHRAGSSSTISSFSAYSSKKYQHSSLGSAGHGFTPHVITVAEGEDVTQKIMYFLQQSMREMCILSASGSISSASLSQPATSGGNIAYEGRFKIISLCGSYVRTEMGGRAGGLSVCLSDTSGQIIGGGVGGPLKAAGPVQVIVGTFMLDNKKNSSGKGDASGSKLPSAIGASLPSFRSPVESLRSPARENDDQPTMGGNPFTMQPTSMHLTPPGPMDWRSGPDFEFTERTGHGGPQSPENGDFE